MLSALTFSSAGGSTNTQEALGLLHRDVFTMIGGDRPDVINKAVVVTDGKSTVDPQNTPIQADLARQAGIELYVLAVGSKVDRKEVGQIASNPVANHVFDLERVEDVVRVSDDMLEVICT